MDILREYKGNILAITDAEVTTDWKLGLLRACGQVAASYVDIDEPRGSFGIFLEGSMNAHLHSRSFSLHGEHCTIVEVYDLTEDSGSRHNFSTFGGTDTDVTLLRAKVTCKCGEIDRAAATYEVSVGEFISLVTNA